MPLSPRQRFLVRGTLVAFAVLGIAAGLVVLGVFPPTANSWYPKCYLYQFTRLYCPGCGLTRALHAALNGRILEAFSQNIFVFLVVPYLLLLTVRSLWQYLWQTPTRPSRLRWPKWSPFVIFGLLLVYAIARNIPAYPFDLLAPRELAVPTADALPVDVPRADTPS